MKLTSHFASVIEGTSFLFEGLANFSTWSPRPYNLVTRLARNLQEYPAEEVWVRFFDQKFSAEAGWYRVGISNKWCSMFWCFFSGGSISRCSLGRFYFIILILLKQWTFFNIWQSESSVSRHFQGLGGGLPQFWGRNIQWNITLW